MTQEEIRNYIPRISTNLDFVALLNMIKKDLYGEKCHAFSLKVVTYYSNPDRAVDAYRKFRIPKKSGGYREISAPCRSLLQIQKCLNVVFQALYEPSSIATGFLPEMSVVDGASRHIGANYVFNTDIKDFFPSINKGRVYRLLTLERYGFSPKIALMVAGLCCMRVCATDRETGDPVVDYVLPQGAPSSPIITNMVCEKLDRRLAGLANRFRIKCSRYADDITFSSQHNVYTKDGKFRKELQRILEDQHFCMNESKTRLQRRTERQEVTGVVVNDRLNVNRRYVRDLQSILYIWEHYGYDTAFARFSKHYRESKPNNKFGGEGFMENVIHGKLMYMKMVKGEDDSVYQRLSARFDALFTPKAEKAKSCYEYELVYTIEQFEMQFDTTVEFKIAPQSVSRSGVNSQSESQPKSTAKRVYATSRLNGRNIYIVVSKNCQETIINLFDDVHEDSKRLGDKTDAGAIPIELCKFKKSGIYNNDIRKKFCVVLMRKKSKRPCWMIMKANPRMAANTVSIDEYLKLIGKTDQLGIFKGTKVSVKTSDKSNMRQQSLDDVLKQFIDSNYDLSILEQWDKTNNS